MHKHRLLHPSFPYDAEGGRERSRPFGHNAIRTRLLFSHLLSTFELLDRERLNFFLFLLRSQERGGGGGRGGGGQSKTPFGVEGGGRRQFLSFVDEIPSSTEIWIAMEEKGEKKVLQFFFFPTPGPPAL